MQVWCQSLFHSLDPPDFLWRFADAAQSVVRRVVSSVSEGRGVILLKLHVCTVCNTVQAFTFMLLRTRYGSDWRSGFTSRGWLKENTTTAITPQTSVGHSVMLKPRKSSAAEILNHAPSTNLRLI